MITDQHTTDDPEPASTPACSIEKDPRRTVRLNNLTVTAGFEDVLRANALDTVEGMFAFSDGESLNKPGLSSWRERIRLTLDVAGTSRTFYLKRFTRPPQEAMREVRRSRTGALSVAGMEWAWLNRLATDGIACPKPIALGEESTGSRERRSALLTEAVPGNSLEQWAGEWRWADRDIIRQLICPTATLVARLHRLGYVHRDLYLAHLFFDPDAMPDRSLHLIDLTRVIRPAWVHNRWIVKDLASLNYSSPAHLVSRADRLRWLKCYLGVTRLDSVGRRLAYRIVGKTDRIARHERRRQARFQSRSQTQ